MEDNYFSENNKFFSLKGVLDRRGMVTNFFIVELVEALLFVTPFMYLMLTHPKLIIDFANSAKTFHYPQWWSIWLVSIGILEGILYFPSIVRRVRDIIGENDNNRIVTISAILSVLILLGYCPIYNPFTQILKWMSFLILLILMFTKGKITGIRPKNELIKFNWGACLGTWLWGLFNKTPITLLMLPLLLTTGWFPFMIICGLKGNEWAYKNKQNQPDLNDFHKSQSNQTIIWVILLPFVLVFGFIAVSIGSGIALNKYMKANPKALSNMTRIVNEYQEAAVKTNFNKIELTDNEYKFYIEPQIWIKLPEASRKNMFQVAANYIQIKKNTDTKKQGNIEIINKIKIYSSYNNEILGERHIDIDELKALAEKSKSGDKGSFKQYMDYLMNGGYKLNLHPSLP